MSSSYSLSSRSSRSSGKTLEGTIANLQGIEQFEKPINILDGKIKLYEIENTKNSHSSSSDTELSLLPTPHFLVAPDSENRDFNSNRLSIPTSSFVDSPIAVFDNNTNLNSNKFRKNHTQNYPNSHSISSKKSSDEEALKEIHEQSFNEESHSSLESELNLRYSSSKSSNSNSDYKIDQNKKLSISSEDFGNSSKNIDKIYAKPNKKGINLEEILKNEKKKQFKTNKTEAKSIMQADIPEKNLNHNHVNEKNIFRDDKKSASIKRTADKSGKQTRKSYLLIAYRIIINMISMIPTPILLPLIVFDILQCREELNV